MSRYFEGELFLIPDNNTTDSGLPTYILEKEFKYVDDNKIIIVPKGVDTDLASIPRFLRRWISPNDKRIAQPAVLHDFLCTYSSYERNRSDEIFFDALKITGTPLWIRALFYIGVSAYTILIKYKNRHNHFLY